MPLYFVSKGRTVMAEGGAVHQGEQVQLDRAEGERLMAAGFVQTTPPNVDAVPMLNAIDRNHVHVGFVSNGGAR